VKRSGIIFRGGIALLVTSPFVTIFPVVSGQGEVRMPLVVTGLIVGTIGLGMIIYGSIQLVRERRIILTENERKLSQLNRENGILALFGLILLPISSSLSSYEVLGSGYGIVPYEAEGIFLGALAVGILFFVGFTVVTKRRSSALLLTFGLLISGYYFLVTGLSETPQPNSTMGVLAFGVFIFGLGIAAAFFPRKKRQLGAL
jgi:hypothetical protein